MKAFICGNVPCHEGSVSDLDTFQKASPLATFVLVLGSSAGDWEVEALCAHCCLTETHARLQDASGCAADGSFRSFLQDFSQI